MVKVGSKPVTFDVHENTLRQTSAFFKAALEQQRWKEGVSGVIELPSDDELSEVDPAVFDAYLQWLYSGKVDYKCDITEKTRESHNVEFVKLAHMYVLGEKVQDDTFCDAVIDTTIDKIMYHLADGTRWFATTDPVNIIYGGTPTGSPARRFLVDIYVRYGKSDWVEEERDVDHEVLLDLARAFLDSRPQPKRDGIRSSSCQWHKHAGGEGCNCLS